MPSYLFSLQEGPSGFLSLSYPQYRHNLPWPWHSCRPWLLVQYLLQLRLKSSGSWLPAWTPALAWPFPVLAGLAPRVWWQRALLLPSPLLPAGVQQGCHRTGLLRSRPWEGYGSTLASGPRLEQARSQGWFCTTNVHLPDSPGHGLGGKLSAATGQSCLCSQETHEGQGGTPGMRVTVTFFMTRLSLPGECLQTSNPIFWPS